jgi:hypothetical protein
MVAFFFDATKVPKLHDFANLPPLAVFDELTKLPRWVAWDFVEVEGKFRKKPISPHKGYGANVGKGGASTWATYEHARDYAERKDCQGVGFVLTEDDDLTGADFDKVRNPETGELEPWVQEIVDLAETYMEISPSGTGVRMFWRGKVEETKKHDAIKVEVYRSGRYLSITGWRLEGTPGEIRPAPKTWALLQARIEAHKAATREAQASVPASTGAVAAPLKPRKEGGSDFFRTVNSAALSSIQTWVSDLFGSAAKFHPGTGAWRVSSKSLGRDLEEDLSIHPSGIVDHGIADMGDNWQGKRTPIDLVMEYGGAPDAVTAAHWLCERMGKARESLGFVAGDSKLGAICAAALLPKTAKPPESGPATAPVFDDGELPDHLANPPGLLGAMTDWICATARRPQRSLAIGAALTILATACGRHLRGPTGSGTHLYVVCLAPTGTGKDHGLQAVLSLLKASNQQQFIGPSQFISMPAVIKFIQRQPSACCPMDEFGAFLKRINKRTASGFEAAISGILRTAWGFMRWVSTSPIRW